MIWDKVQRTLFMEGNISYERVNSGTKSIIIDKDERNLILTHCYILILL